MYTAKPDVLELTGSTFGMRLIKVDGEYWYGHKLCPESFEEKCQTKCGPYSSLEEAVRNLNVYLKAYGGSARLSPACFDDKGNPQHPDTDKFYKGSDW